MDWKQMQFTGVMVTVFGLQSVSGLHLHFAMHCATRNLSTLYFNKASSVVTIEGREPLKFKKTCNSCFKIHGLLLGVCFNT